MCGVVVKRMGEPSCVRTQHEPWRAAGAVSAAVSDKAQLASERASDARFGLCMALASPLPETLFVPPPAVG
jgi:hypothetical protein